MGEAELTEAGERYEERSEWLGRLEKEMAEQGGWGGGFFVYQGRFTVVFYRMRYELP